MANRFALPGAAFEGPGRAIGPWHVGRHKAPESPLGGQTAFGYLATERHRFEFGGQIWGSLRPLLRESACPLTPTSVEWVPGGKDVTDEGPGRDFVLLLRIPWNRSRPRDRYSRLAPDGRRHPCRSKRLRRSGAEWNDGA